MTVVAYVDAKGAFRAWLNQLSTLTGPNTPMPKGFFLFGSELRSPDAGAWGVLSSVGGDDRLIASASPSRARIMASIRGVTVQDADVAAAAYANALRGIAGVRTVFPGGVICHMVGDITGPLDVAAVSEPQRLVYCDLHLSA